MVTALVVRGRNNQFQPGMQLPQAIYHTGCAAGLVLYN